MCWKKKEKKDRKYKPSKYLVLWELCQPGSLLLSLSIHRCSLWIYRRAGLTWVLREVDDKMGLMSKDFCRGNTCVRETAERVRKGWRALRPRKADPKWRREGRTVGWQCQDCCAVQERLRKAVGAKARFHVRLLTCLLDVLCWAQSLAESSRWEAGSGCRHGDGFQSTKLDLSCNYTSCSWKFTWLPMATIELERTLKVIVPTLWFCTCRDLGTWGWMTFCIGQPCAVEPILSLKHSNALTPVLFSLSQEHQQRCGQGHSS